MDIIRYSEYDRFAWIYNKHWAEISLQWLPLVERLVLEEIPAGCNILDLCCGTGNFANLLSEKGYRVTGIDASEEMLKRARENAFNTEFLLEDARSFKLPSSFHAVISLFDSLNHIMSIEEMNMVFRNVYSSLLPEGIFFFDLNMEEAFADIWANLDRSIVKNDYVCITRSSYNSSDKTGSFDATIFRFIQNWERTDVKLLQKCYSEDEITNALQEAGFRNINVLESQKDLHLSIIGRSFFTCEKK